MRAMAVPTLPCNGGVMTSINPSTPNTAREKQIDLLIRHGASSADMVGTSPEALSMTGAQLTRACLREALIALEANGLISFVPMEQWPDYYVATPPYVHPFAASPSKGEEEE